MKTSIYSILLLVFSISIYAQPVINPNGFNVFSFETGIIASEGFLKDSKPDGYWKTYHPNGKLKSQGNRKNFLLDSLWIFYSPLGDTLQKINYLFGKKNGYFTLFQVRVSEEDTLKNCPVSIELYVNDVKQGEALYFYKNCNKKEILRFKNNRKNGIYTEYDETGNIITQGEYLNNTAIRMEKINRVDKSNQRVGLWRYFFPSGIVSKEEEYVNGLIHGYVREYNTNGTLKSSIRYENGKPVEQGADLQDNFAKIEKKQEYHRNGKLKSIGQYKNGKPIGVYKEYNEKGVISLTKTYDEDGNLLAEGIIDDKNLFQGKWIEYQNGKVSAKGEYKNSDKNGKWEFFYKNDSLQQSGSYNAGKQEGLWKWYYPNGKLARQEFYLKGKLDGFYAELNENGDTLSKGQYISGEKEGIWIYNNGDHYEKGEYKSGQKEGEWNAWYPNGKLKYTGVYKRDTQDGRHIFYFEDGVLMEERYYARGKREGNWNFYNEDGYLIVTITYRSDKEIKVDGVRIDERRKN